MPSSSPPHAPASAPARLAIVDLARGAAIAQMIAYHFCYDLNYFSWIHVALTRDAPWIAWRTAIVSQFLFLVGVSLTLRGASEGAAERGRFWKRWAQIAGCACLVSLASWWLFGARWIWFGVLHFVAVAQLLLLALSRRGPAVGLLGIVVLAMGGALQFALFDDNALSWIGFSPTKPQTEDFVPLFPWLGVVLLGMGAASFWRHSDAAWAQALRRCRTGRWRPLAFLGRWPLSVYMLHQPLLFAVLFGVRALLQIRG